MENRMRHSLFIYIIPWHVDIAKFYITEAIIKKGNKNGEVDSLNQQKPPNERNDQIFHKLI